MVKFMKASELTSLWSSPDNTRLTPKQFSMRLPLHVAAKISALCDMYANKTRTEIIGDLLTTALEDLEASFTHVEGEYIGTDELTNEAITEDVGLGAKFRKLASNHLEALEKELDGVKSDN